MSRLRAPGAVVCIPARNEAEHLPTLLHSLAAQSGFDREARLGVVVVANGCDDGTEEIACAFADAAPMLALRVVEATLPPDAAHVGTARRMALDAGADWLAGEEAGDGVLLTTDADARLPPDWVLANLAALEDAEIVGGALVIEERSADPALARLNAEIARYWEAVRAIEDRLDPPPHDPAPRHGDHTGASLALRAALYRRVGGLPPLPGGEDNALVALVVEAGGRLRHDPAIRVNVSDRTVGRTACGMAQDMARRLAAARGEGVYRLPHPDHWRDVIATRAALRLAWRRGAAEAERLLRELGVDAVAIARIGAAGCPNDIAFVERASKTIRFPDPAEVPVGETPALFAPHVEGVRGAA